MNVLMHAATGFALVVLITNTDKPESKLLNRSILLQSFIVFLTGIILHGILDYIPHCYPINSKVDAILSLLMMTAFVLFAARKYKFILAASFLGNLFPDLIDLSAGILNKYLNLNFTESTKIFPWHWPKYSGSIYDGDCNVSNLNHLMIVFLIFLVCILKRKNLKNIFLNQ